MRNNRLHLFVILITFATLSSCTDNQDEIVVVQGAVSESSTGNAIPNATVQVTTPQEFNNVFSRTDDAGNYALGEINVIEVTDLTITASATDYNDQVRNLKVAPGDNITGFDFELTKEGTGNGTPGNNDDDEDVVVGEPAGAARLQLLNVSEESIDVRGTGGIENSTFTFAVLDSAGRIITLQNSVEVQFNIIKGPDGGEVLIPDRVETNANGVAVANLASGDSSGVVRIEAVVERPEVGLTIRSQPVIIAIGSGFPAPDRFFVAAENTNLEGFGLIPGQGSSNYDYIVTASVGDKHGNPVKDGTAVDFRSELGGIIERSALTDENGRASVILRPDGSTPSSHPFGTGFFRVIGKTVDENNDYITQSLDLLFTTSEALISISPSTINIPSNGSQTFAFTVTDLNGNPMAAGTEIEVEAADGIEVSGDIGFTLGNYFEPGPGSTEFAFTASDTDEENSDEVGTSLTIRVTAPSSGKESSFSIQGTRAKY